MQLFYLLLSELEDITLYESMSILVEAMLQALTEIFKINEEQLEDLVDNFYERLPKYMQRTLSRVPD